MKIAIIGFGTVGRSIAHLCSLSETEYYPYDLRLGSKDVVNGCDIAFVCVPTPADPDGSINLSALEEVFSWLKSPLVIIKSTVPVGTTRRFAKKYKHGKVMFSPEFLRDGHWMEDAITGLMRFIIGTTKALTTKEKDLIVDLFNNISTVSKYTYFCDSRDAEMAKLMLNTFFATKVTFVNEIKLICGAVGADYPKVRELFRMDARVGLSHDTVTAEGGFGGHCFPKDLRGLINSSRTALFNPHLLSSVWLINEQRFKGNAVD